MYMLSIIHLQYNGGKADFSTVYLQNWETHTKTTYCKWMEHTCISDFVVNFPLFKHFKYNNTLYNTIYMVTCRLAMGYLIGISCETICVSPFVLIYGSRIKICLLSKDKLWSKINRNIQRLYLFNLFWIAFFAAKCFWSGSSIMCTFVHV